MLERACARGWLCVRGKNIHCEYAVFDESREPRIATPLGITPTRVAGAAVRIGRYRHYLSLPLLLSLVRVTIAHVSVRSLKNSWVLYEIAERRVSL